MPVHDAQGNIVGYTPRVGVALHLNGTTIFRMALFDSGADDTTIPAEVAADLGHAFAMLPFSHHATGVGSKFKCHTLPGLTIEYKDWSIIGDVLVAEPGTLDVILLGRADFFSHFSVQFCWYMKPPEYYVLPADGADLPEAPAAVPALLADATGRTDDLVGVRPPRSRHREAD